MEEKIMNFNAYELGAIDILVISEIYNCKERLEKDEFSYKEDKISCINFLKTLEKIHDKINERKEE